MKQIILTLLLCIPCFVMAQNKEATFVYGGDVVNGYHHYTTLTSGKVWNYTIKDKEDNNIKAWIELRNSTITENYIMTNLYFCTSEEEKFIGHYYEYYNNFIVFKYDDENQKQLYVFDFFPRIGYVGEYYGNIPSPYKDRIIRCSDLIAKDNILYRRFALYCKDNNSKLDDYWVPGIGSRNYGILNPVIDNLNEICDGELTFESVTQDGEVVFTREDFDLPALRPDTYEPMLEDGKEWQVGSFDAAVLSENPSMTASFHFGGDTIINGQKCKKMYRSGDYVRLFDQNSSCYTLSFDPSIIVYEGALYEEGKRVYIYLPDKEESSLLYDFGMSVGETVVTRNGSVTKLGDQYDMVDGKVIHINITSSCYWIEGCGSSAWPTWSKVGDTNYWALMFCKDNEKYFYKYRYFKETDAIDLPHTTIFKHSNDAIYDLQGRRVQTPQRGGLYIKNGHQFLQK